MTLAVTDNNKEVLMTAVLGITEKKILLEQDVWSGNMGDGEKKGPPQSSCSD